MRNRAVLPVAIVAFVAGTVVSAAWAQRGQYYVLDSFGGVHAVGGAATISPPTPYFGFDVAADIEYIPVGTTSIAGDGIAVLDKLGGVHYGGALASDPPSGAPPYFGFDAARAIVYRDVPTRAVGSITNTNTPLGTSFTAIRSTVIFAPDDGFILALGSVAAFCNPNAADATAQFSMNVNSTSASALDAYYAGFESCDPPPGLGSPVETVSMVTLFPVSAGNHTVNLLGRKAGGSATVEVSGHSLVAVFIDQDSQGGS